MRAFSPGCCLLSFPPCTQSEQDPILLDYSRCLVNSKHNQTLRSLSLCGVELKAYSSVAVSNYLLRASVHCAGTFPFHYSTQAAPIENQPAAELQQQQQHSGPWQPCIAGVCVCGEGSFQAAVNSSFCLGKRLMPIQTTGAVRFFLTTTLKNRAGRHSAPPQLCLSQLLSRSTFPSCH